MRLPFLYGVGGKSNQLMWLTGAGVKWREFMLPSLLRRYVCISVILDCVWHLMKHNCLRFRLDKSKMWNLFPITSAVPMVTGSLWVAGETDINNVASFRSIGKSCVQQVYKHSSDSLFGGGGIKQSYNACIIPTHFAAQQVQKSSICWICLQWIGLAAIFFSLDVANTGDATLLEIQERS